MKALYWPHINNGLFVTIRAFEIDRLGQKFNLAQMLNFDLVRKAIVGGDGEDGVEIRIIQWVFVNPKVYPDPVLIVVEDQRCKLLGNCTFGREVVAHCSQKPRSFGRGAAHDEINAVTPSWLQQQHSVCKFPGSSRFGRLSDLPLLCDVNLTAIDRRDLAAIAAKRFRSSPDYPSAH